ncbi:hypothetical protein [Agrobacterium pusense]|uniref:hypothetical protein n=1 Tax=Agrobacterium pusense TaxID=648995 RepID=UPI002FDE4E76
MHGFAPGRQTSFYEEIGIATERGGWTLWFMMPPSPAQVKFSPKTEQNDFENPPIPPGVRRRARHQISKFFLNNSGDADTLALLTVRQNSNLVFMSAPLIHGVPYGRNQSSLELRF